RRAGAALGDACSGRPGSAEARLPTASRPGTRGANANTFPTGKPGSELGPPYLARLADEIAGAVLEAREALAPAWVTYGAGRCALAAHRHYWAEEAGRFACGYNPDAPAGATVPGPPA